MLIDGDHDGIYFQITFIHLCCLFMYLHVCACVCRNACASVLLARPGLNRYRDGPVGHQRKVREGIGVFNVGGHIQTLVLLLSRLRVDWE